MPRPDTAPKRRKPRAKGLTRAKAMQAASGLNPVTYPNARAVKLSGGGYAVSYREPHSGALRTTTDLTMLAIGTSVALVGIGLLADVGAGL